LKAKFAVIALFLVLALSIVAPLQAQNPQPSLTIDVSRFVAVGAWGVLHVGDHFLVHNNGTTPVDSLEFGFPRAYLNNIYNVQAKDKQGTSLVLDADVNGTSSTYWMRVHFIQPLTSNQTYDFTVAMAMANLIQLVPTGIQYNFTAAPILTQDARVANSTFVAPTGSNFVLSSNATYMPVTVNGLPGLFRQFKPWKAYQQDTFYAPYRSINQFLLDLVYAERDIIIHSTGGLSVTDTYKMKNNGLDITSFTITLPDSATNVMAYDVVGAMWATPQNPAPPYTVTVQPRYSSGFKNGKNFTFTMTYDVPASRYLKQVSWWGKYNLTFPLLDNRDDFLYDNASVKIITPDGVSINMLQIPAQSPLAKPIEYDPQSRTFKLQGVTDLNNVTVGAIVNYLPFWSAFGSLPWLLGLEVAIAVFALAVRIRRGPELAVPVPVERLREFVGLYDEKLALSRELDDMEEEVARGGLVKHEFRRRKKVIKLRLDEINRSLMEVKAQLRTVTPRYDELIRRIDRAEAEIDVSKNSLNQVRAQYRSGRTTRETYDHMVNDLTKRVDRAEETVETILITLREDAR
jgi:hypothetical protein